MNLRRIKTCLLNPIVAAGLWMGTIGSGSNWLCIKANDGMPVTGQVGRRGIHIEMTTHTRLAGLGDWIRLESVNRVISPGDCLIVAGIAIGSAGMLFGVWTR